MGQVLSLLDIVVQVVVFAIIGRALLSWFVRDPSNPIMKLLIDVTEPILAPIRNRLPQTMTFDLSPLIAILVIQVVWRLVVSLVLAT